MQKSPYTTAGIQLSPGICMNVRSYVRVPDGEVDRGMGPKPFEAPLGKKRTAHRSVTISRTSALLFLAVVAVIMGALVLNKRAAMNKLSASISRIDNQITETVRSNSDLTVEVMQARDSARIGYEAVQNIGMIAAAGVDSVPVMAPETRPYENTFSGLMGSSPLPGGSGILSGSR